MLANVYKIDILLQRYFYCMGAHSYAPFLPLSPQVQLSIREHATIVPFALCVRMSHVVGDLPVLKQAEANEDSQMLRTLVKLCSWLAPP
jgi:hypothetical protein